MRIVHVAPTIFGPGGLFGGGERYPLELARALAVHEDVTLISFGVEDRAWTEPGGLRIRVLRSRIHLRRHPAHPLAPLLPAALRNADVVHTHHTRSAPSRIAALAARSCGIFVVTTDHGLGGGGWAGVLPRLFHQFLAVSQFAASVTASPKPRTRVIYGGADPNVFRPDPGVSRRGVLYVGRLTPHKGVDRLIRALPDGVHLTVAGTGGHDRKPPECHYPQLLRQLARGREVTFTGPVNDGELPVLIRQASALVLPSVNVTCYGRTIGVSELLGLVLLEAMASETPVIASDLGGLPEVVCDGDTGFLVPPADVAALQERISELARNRPLAQRMGRSGREWVLDRFTWQHCAQRCLAAYADSPSGPR
jgi:glycosyltransferase involved in cell wall biosynthesis